MNIWRNKCNIVVVRYSQTMVKIIEKEFITKIFLANFSNQIMKGFVERFLGVSWKTSRRNLQDDTLRNTRRNL